MATVYSFTGFALGTGSDEVDLDDNGVSSGDSFTIPTSASGLTLLVEDDDTTAAGDVPTNEQSGDSNQLMYAFDSSGTPVAATDGEAFYVEATVTFTANGASYVGFLIETNDGDDYFIFPPDVPEGVTATVTSVDFAANNISYDEFASGDEDLGENGSSLDLSGADTLYAGDGNDNVSAGAGADVIYGGEGRDSILAEGGSDQVFGGFGDDTIDGGTEADTIDGGGDDDSILGGGGNDSITGGGGQDTIDGGDGNDTIDGDFAGAAEASVSRLSFKWSELPDPSGNGTAIDDGDNLVGGASQDTGGVFVNVTLVDDGAAAFNENGSNQAFDYNDSDNQYVTGIDGGGETVDNNSALYIGGASRSSPGDTSTVRIDFSSTDATLQNEVSNVDFRINDIDDAGWRDIVIIRAYDADGNRIDVTLTAGSGMTLSDTADTDGAGGSDFVGNDTVTAINGQSGSVSDAAFSLRVQVPGPVARIEIDYGNLETDFQRIDVTDIYFDTIPSTYSDSIDGGAGSDTIDGNLGDDIIDGGTGNDSIQGGDDEDVIQLSDNFGTDTIDGGAGGTDNDTLDASGLTGHGVDIVLTATEDGTVSDQTNAAGTFEDIENFVLSNQDDNFDGSAATGSLTLDGMGGADSIEGGTAADSISGGTGDDTIQGGTGNDTLDGGADIDTADYSDASGPVTVNLASETATGADGNDVLTNFENIRGSSSDDTLTGDGGDNVIDGNGGDDTLTGGGGNDTLISDGGDTLFGGSGSDTADFSDPDGAGNDVEITIDSNTLAGSDTAGGSYSGVETFVADELDGTDPDLVDDDTITISNTVTGTDVSGFDDTATGTFTPAAGPDAGTPIAFGGPGQPLLSELLSSGPGGGDPNGTFRITGGDTDGTIGAVNMQNFETVTFSMVCFTRGTMIATPSGEVAIEDLKVGDMVLTRDHGPQPLRWIGSRKVPAEGRLAPVVFREGAIGNDRELRVSPQHRMLVTDWRAELLFGTTDVLVAAKDLVNGDTVYVAEGGEVDYFHILFDTHQIVTANGAPSESFHPGETSMGMLEDAAREEVLELFPELRDDLDRGYGQAARPSLKGWEARALRR